MKEIIVHCPTEELLEKVKEKLSLEYPTWRKEWTVGCGLRLDDGEYEGFDDIKIYKRILPNISIISAQEYLGETNQLTYSEFLDYIKEHGKTKARITENWRYCTKESVVEFHLYRTGDLISDGINWNSWKDSYKGKFELVESQPFEDKSASEQGYYIAKSSNGQVEAGDLVKIINNHTGFGCCDVEIINRKYNGFVVCDPVRLRPATQSEIDEVLGKKTKMIEAIPSHWTIPKYETIEELDRMCEEKNNQSIIKKTMDKVTRFMKNATLSADEKLLRENGLKDECGNYTGAYENIVEFLLDQEYEVKVIAQLKATLEAEKEK